MDSGDMGSVVKQTLKTLCVNNGWSYGVFWCFDKKNSMLLTVEDAYCEEQMGTLIDDVLLQVHMLGEGVIGQAAFTGKHRWMFSDSESGEWKFINSFENQDIFQEKFEFHRQFSSGIKTIAVVSVEPRGVVQFGSTQKILEKLDFLDQTKIFFKEIQNACVLLENEPSSLHSEPDDLSGLFTSLISSYDSNMNHKSLQGGGCIDLTGRASSSTDLIHSPSFMSEVHQRGMTPACEDSFNDSNDQFLQELLQSTYPVNSSTVATPCISTWDTEGSILTSSYPELPSEMSFLDFSEVFTMKEDTLISCSNTRYNLHEGLASTNLNGTRGLTDAGKAEIESSRNLVDNQYSSLIQSAEYELLNQSPNLRCFPEQFDPTDFDIDLSTVDNLSHWFPPLLDNSISRMTMSLKNDNSQLCPTSTPSLFGVDTITGTLVKHSDNSACSSITNAFNSDDHEIFFNVCDAENDLFDGLGVDFGCRQVGDGTKMPVVSSGCSTVSAAMSECVSELDVGSAVVPCKGLLSELGIEEILNSISSSSSVTKSSFENQFSSNKRKLDSFSVSSKQDQLKTASFPDGRLNLVQPTIFNREKTSSLALKKEILPKSQVGLWIDDSYSINAASAVLQQPKKEEPTKAARKRARPGESTRPRPKDRQQIQDRIKELRGLVPNGQKSSIDSLLDRTIKYMLFLQSQTNYADKLKLADEPKLIANENGVVLKDKNKDYGGGATWAYEVGGQTMVCPIIVEDLSPPGQMLIEMLCEDKGFFLEIADIIRGFGLNILKGVMELRENKIWARFIVEASKFVTRMDIFLSLVQLLQETATSGIDSSNPPSNVVNMGNPVLNNYQPPPLPHPISLTETHK